MVVKTLFTRILIDGAILTAIVSSILVLMLYFKPRMALSDYPEDVRAAVPPRTKDELRWGIILSIPMLIIVLAILLYSTYILNRQIQGGITYWLAFVTIFGELLMVSLFDLIVLDILMFYSWTPSFLVLPGTEGFPGYKDYRPHVKTQLIKGNVILVIFSLLLALIPTFVF
jgi:hypothetical protein